MTNDQKNFITRVAADIFNLQSTPPILPSLTIAQAILESNWGKSGLTVRANALFGIKATSAWKGRVYSAKTQECYDGINFTTITALFRAYESWVDSIADHTSLIIGAPRYREVVNERDYIKACKAIHLAGYATDPAYAAKLISLIERYDLQQHDTKAVSVPRLAPVTVVIDGATFFVPALTIRNQLFVTLPQLGDLQIPLRDALTSSGYTVSWHAPTATVTAVRS